MATQAVILRPTVAPVLWTEEQVELIKRTVARDATNDELALFMHVCKRTGLDPFVRQIYAIKRNDRDGSKKMSVQTSIDGYRLIADRTGQYVGSDAPIYDSDTAAHPEWARVTVYKLVAGEPRPFTATARWLEYFPAQSSQQFMWNRMPFLMLGKVCEALALRKAFPQELSGLYTNDEMQQAEGDPGSVAGPRQTARRQEPRQSGSTKPPVHAHETVTGVKEPRQALLDEIVELHNVAIAPLKHTGMRKAILHHCFDLEQPDRLKDLSLETLAGGMDLFRELTGAVVSWDRKTHTPDEWIAEQQRLIAQRVAGQEAEEHETVDPETGELLKDMPDAWLTEAEQAQREAENQELLTQQNEA